MKLVALAANLLVLGTGLTAAIAQGSASAVGHWHVDFARSINPWSSHPKSVTLDVLVDDETRYEATETITGSDGIEKRETIRARYDDKPYPVEGSPSNATVSLSRLSADRRRIQVRTPDGFRSLIVCGLSADLKTMICDETNTPPDNVNKSAKSVYVRD
jgi:hypothetical protein